MKKNKLYIQIFVFFLIPLTANAQLFPLSENSWSNPEFVKRYMGSYGIDSELSPEITETESSIMQDLATFLEEDVNSGINFLLPKITEVSSPALDFMLGQMYLQNGDNVKAVEAYAKAIRKFPSFLRAYKNIALAYMQYNNCDGAMPHLNKVLEMGRADGLIYGFLGYCNLFNKKYAAAISAYSIARLYQPNSRDWKTGSAQASFHIGRYEETIAILDELIDAEGPQANYLMLQTNAYLAIDDRDMAIADLEILNRINEATGQSLMLLGDLYMQNEMPSLATKSYLLAIENAERPEFERAKKSLNYLVRVQQWTDAESYLAKIKNIYGDQLIENEQLSVIIIQAEIDQGKGDFQNAGKMLANVISKDPMNGKALLLLARNHTKAGNYELAEFYYDRAALVDEFAFDALLDNARMAVDFRRLNRALILLNKAYEIRPSSDLKSNIDILQNALNSQS